MKKSAMLALAALTVLGGWAPTPVRAQDVDKVAPVVVKTVPQAGLKDVNPGILDIKVVFSKDMADKSWSWSTAWQNSTPALLGPPRYDSDKRTCVLRVKLEPGKTYGWWLNSQQFHGFQDTDGRAAVPYLLVFKVRDATEVKAAPAPQSASQPGVQGS